MQHDRPRWRFRISTLMLLVIIAAPSLALVVGHRKRTLSEQQALANGRMALAEARRALAAAQQAEVQARKSILGARDAVRRAYQNPGDE